MSRFLLPITGLVIVGVFVAGALSGLPTTRKGKVGDTLEAKTVSARLIEVDDAGPLQRRRRRLQQAGRRHRRL